MKQEHKELLLKDLCSRLPYGVKICYEAVIQFPEGEVLESIDVTTNIVSSKSVVADFEDVKPYLFPLSSMTEEQKEEYKQFFEDINGYAYSIDCVPQIEWLLKNHFDIYGLIPMGLAIDATTLNIY